MISMLISAGYSDRASVLRNRDRDSNYLQIYRNIRGKHLKEQLKAVFCGKSKEQGSGRSEKVEQKYDNTTVMEEENGSKRARYAEAAFGPVRASNSTFGINYFPRIQV